MSHKSNSVKEYCSLKCLYMCAAIWRACYPIERDFITVWRPSEMEYVLLDAAESGFYSFQVEGLLCKYLAEHGSRIPFAAFGGIPKNDFPFSRVLDGEEWKELALSNDDWDALQLSLHECFMGGFYGHDLYFSDKAIRALQTDDRVPPGSCGKLTPADFQASRDYSASRADPHK